MAEVWKLEVDYEYVSICGRSWYMIWNWDIALAADAAMLLDLVEVDISMRWHDEEKIMIHADYRKAWEMVVADGLKEMQLEGDGGSIVSDVIEI